MSVDLPEPDGPMIAVNSPARELDVDAVEGVHDGVTLAVDLARRRWPGPRSERSDRYLATQSLASGGRRTGPARIDEYMVVPSRRAVVALAKVRPGAAPLLPTSVGDLSCGRSAPCGSPLHELANTCRAQRSRTWRRAESCCVLLHSVYGSE